MPGQRVGGGFEQGRGELRGVHADEHGRHGVQPVGVGEGGREPLVQPTPALRDHRETGRQPGTWQPLEGEDLVRRARRGHRVQGVLQGGGREPGGLFLGAGRAESGLDLAGYRLLGDDQDLRHAVSLMTRRMSPMARTVPRTVPVTLEGPARRR